MVTQTDIKGAIPRFLVNTTAAKTPGMWIDNLRAACVGSVKAGEGPPVYIPRPAYMNGKKINS